MNRVSSDLVGLMSRDTACPPALRQRPVPPVMAKTLLGWSKASPWAVNWSPPMRAMAWHWKAVGGAGRGRRCTPRW